MFTTETQASELRRIGGRSMASHLPHTGVLLLNAFNASSAFEVLILLYFHMEMK